MHEGKMLYLCACTEWSSMHSQYLHEWILLKFKILLSDNNDKGSKNVVSPQLLQAMRATFF